MSDDTVYGGADWSTVSQSQTTSKSHAGKLPVTYSSCRSVDNRQFSESIFDRLLIYNPLHRVLVKTAKFSLILGFLWIFVVESMADRRQDGRDAMCNASRRGTGPHNKCITDRPANVNI